MITLLVALASMQEIPESASVLYPAFPETGSTLQMPTHSAQYRLEKKWVMFESTSTLRNPSSAAMTATVRIPVRGNRATAHQISSYTINASVNKAAATLTPGPERKTQPSDRERRSGIAAQSYEKIHSLNLSFKPRETKSLVVRWKAPIGTAGLDSVQRMVVYDTAGASSWAGGVGQFNYALKYSQNLILQVYATLPEGKWQVGNTGAFLKHYQYVAPSRPHLIFTYYPNSLDEIGD